jgi:hypothetical protein
MIAITSKTLFVKMPKSAYNKIEMQPGEWNKIIEHTFRRQKIPGWGIT